MKKITWRQINSQNISTLSGIYAWYYEHNISDFDIQEQINKINKEKNIEIKKNIIKIFLQDHIFSYYEESPYDALITGKLKATYSGKLIHKNTVSENLVGRIIENPLLLNEIKNILVSISSSFMSPLYIGMAKKLLVRLKKHKFLIEKYRSEGIPNNAESNIDDEIRDHNFASRVIKKNFTETNLYVVVKELEKEESLHNIMENILNRINHPVLGRN